MYWGSTAGTSVSWNRSAMSSALAVRTKRPHIGIPSRLACPPFVNRHPSRAAVELVTTENAG